MATATSNATKKVLDFSNVKEQSGINPRNVPEGDYVMRVASVTEGNSGAGNPQWIFILECDEIRGGKYPYYCGLVENQLWKIRNLFTAAGINVPKKKLAVDPNKIVGKLIGVELVDDEHEGRVKSTINAIFDKDEVSGDGAEIPDDEDEVDEIEEDEEEEAPVKKAPAKKAVRKKPAPVEEDDEEDEEEDEEEEPAPKRRPAKKAAPKKKAPVVEDDDEEVEDEDLEELDIDEV